MPTAWRAPYSYLRKDCWQWLRPLPSACPARRSTTIQRGWFLSDSRRPNCHHLPDDADGDCHANGRGSGSPKKRRIRLMRADSLKDTLRIVGAGPSYASCCTWCFPIPAGTVAASVQHPHIGSGGDIVTMMIPFLGTSFLPWPSPLVYRLEAPLLMIAFFCGLYLPFGVSHPLELGCRGIGRQPTICFRQVLPYLLL